MTDPQPLEARRLTRRFGSLIAVSDLDLDVRAGEIAGFLGPNGAGKTTTLRMCSGLLKPDAGEIRVAGHPLTGDATAARSRLGFVPDRPFLYERLSAREFLDFVAALYDVSAERAQARAKAAGRRNPNTPRDQFVQFFLAGAEQGNTAEYEAGIPQALRLMNSRIVGNPAAVRAIAPPGAKPAEAFEAIYLAALSRRPTTDEVTRLKEYVAKVENLNEAYGDILWAVLNGSEFTTVR